MIGSLALAFLLLGSAPSRAESVLTICNEGREDLRLAMLWQNAPLYPMMQSWKVYGWSNIAPGCSDILRTGGVMEVFLSVKDKTHDGWSIMHYPFDSEEERNSLTSGVLTAERFFCVADEPFDRVLDTLDAHENCPPGYYPQLFNLYVTLDPYKHFTLRLGN